MPVGRSASMSSGQRDTPPPLEPHPALDGDSLGKRIAPQKHVVGMNPASLRDLFPGPRPFTEAEKERFFGRTKEKNELRGLLRAYRTVLLHAQSGAGKTSLVRAGLIPLLQEEGIPWTRCRVGGLDPSAFDEERTKNYFVANALMTGFNLDAAEAARITTFTQAFENLENSAEHLLVLDQFEELFTNYPHRWTDRESFFEHLSDLLEAKARVRILFVIREEFISRLETFAHHLPEEFQIRLFLERLNKEQAAQAVRGPFATADVEFDSDKTLDFLIDNLRLQKFQFGMSTPSGNAAMLQEYKGEFVEPVQLQVVCRTLAAGIEKTGKRQIDREIIDKFGDPSRSLIRFYEDGLAEVAREHGVRRGRLRRWFDQRMITAGGTRGTVFMGARETAGLPNDAVRGLEAAHLIRSEQRAGGTWYEVTHDRLIDPIRRSNEESRLRQIRALLVFGVVLAVLTVAGGITYRAYQPDRAAEDQRLVEETRRVTTEQLTQTFFEKAVVSPDAPPADQALQKEVARLVAAFSVKRQTDLPGAQAELKTALRKLFESDRLQVLLSVDKILGLSDDEEVRDLRRQLLADPGAVNATDQPLRAYICSHNASVVIASGKTEGADYELSRWKKEGFRQAILGKPTEPNAWATPVIADYLLSCQVAMPLVEALNEKYKTGAFIQSYYQGCQPCSKYHPYRRYGMFPMPGTAGSQTAAR
jgi:hypothetical protein